MQERERLGRGAALLTHQDAEGLVDHAATGQGFLQLLSQDGLVGLPKDYAEGRGGLTHEVHGVGDIGRLVERVRSRAEQVHRADIAPSGSESELPTPWATAWAG